MTERIVFLVDGFNVYHSVRECLKKKEIQHGRWFDYRKYFEWVVKTYPDFRPNSVVSRVRLYTALANHMDPGVVDRHKIFLKALDCHGVEHTLGNFKRKTLNCRATCREKFQGHEEKETDINVALGVIEAFVRNEADCAVIVSGDTDLIPAIRTAKALFENIRVGILTPAHKKNQHFRQFADFTIAIKPEHYAQFQLPPSINLPNGKIITKPPAW